ncbi:TPA: SHOCT domain-containing protein, partial [Enterococcus faecium]|nr:SHOCT domain-containing protein [Enterococcus faecium]
RSSMLYKNAIVQADKILSTLDILLKETSKEQINIIAENQVFSPADELRKYKELLDDGIINQEEFNIKKKELLDL